ncbi:2276_t:CDS:2, partial [Funneliformis geosporum]
MSDFASGSTVNIKTEIVRLAESQKEKACLLAHFTKHQDQQAGAFSDLSNFEEDENKLDYLRAFLPVSTSKINTEHVHVFVDNSNLYVEAKYSVGQLERIYDRVKVINEDTKVEEYRQVYYMKHLRIDYGCLLTTILSGRSMGSSPVIVGSRPPSDDTLWNKVKSLGYEVTVYDRNNENKEKRVDMKLGISMVVQTLLKAKGPGVLVLIAGDGDCEPALEEILKAGWKVEIRFWASAISRYLKTPDITRENKELKIVYEPLDKEYQNFTFCVGPDLTRNKSVFRIEREDMNHNWSSEEIMKCYTELQLFCWWYETDDGALELYFKSSAQLERADRWMMKNFPNVKAWKIQ